MTVDSEGVRYECSSTTPDGVDFGRGQNRTPSPLSALWPAVFAGEKDLGPHKGEMWAKSSGSTVGPTCFRCLTASPRWAVLR